MGKVWLKGLLKYFTYYPYLILNPLRMNLKKERARERKKIMASWNTLWIIASLKIRLVESGCSKYA